jgi:hypothetical protein
VTRRHQKKKKKKRKKGPQATDPSAPARFDRGQLTPADHALLARFRQRRATFDAFLAHSNIIYHLRSCPACGFPTLAENSAYEICIICLWEDCGYDDAQETVMYFPNHIALIQLRLEIAAAMDRFLDAHALAPSPEALTHRIRQFRADLHGGQVELDIENLVVNWRRIFPLATA